MKKLLNILILLILLTPCISTFALCHNSFSKTTAQRNKLNPEINNFAISILCLSSSNKSIYDIFDPSNCSYFKKHINSTKNNYKNIHKQSINKSPKNVNSHFFNDKKFTELSNLDCSKVTLFRRDDHTKNSNLNNAKYEINMNKKSYLQKNIEKTNFENTNLKYSDDSILKKLTCRVDKKNLSNQKDFYNKSSDLIPSKCSENEERQPIFKSKYKHKTESSKINHLPTKNDDSSKSYFDFQSTKEQSNKICEEYAKLFKVNDMLKTIPVDTMKKLEYLGFHGPHPIKLQNSQKNPFYLIKDTAQDCLKKITKPLMLLAVIMGICSIISNTFPGFSKTFSSDITNLICTLSMATVLVLPFSETIKYVSDIFKISGKMLLCYIPVITGIMVSSGQHLTSSVNSTFLIGFANFILQTSSTMFVPILNTILAFACICAVTSQIDFSGIFLAISKAIKISLGILVTIFVGFFSIKASVNLAAEGAGTKALRFLLGSCVPIVGKALSDAASTIRGSINLLKTSTCAFFVASLIITFLPALIQCLIWHLTTSLCSSVGESLQLNKISKFLKNLTEITGIMIILIICFLAIIISSTLLVMKSANNFN